MTAHVWLVQCLCGPNRHAIAALAGEFDNENEAQMLVTNVRALVAEMVTPSGDINPWCGICGALAAGWRYELARTRFATMKEAEPHLYFSEATNAITNALFGSHGPDRPKRH